MRRAGRATGAGRGPLAAAAPVLATLVLVALVLAACGSSGSTVTPATATTAVPTTATTAVTGTGACGAPGEPVQETVSEEGIEVVVPEGWHVVFGRPPAGADGATPAPYLHAGSFALPDTSGSTFGGPATEAMGPDDVFVALVEYGPESVGQPLFAHDGLPCRLTLDRFRTDVGQPAHGPGQAAYQAFFTAEDRAFSLLAVIGSPDGGDDLVGQVNGFLAGVDIDERD